MLLKSIKCFARANSGATAIEYALLGSLISLMLVTGFAVLGNQTSMMFGRVGMVFSTEGTSTPSDAPPQAPVTPAPDFIVSTNIPFYHSSVYQNWFERPSGVSPNEWNEQSFTLSGGGNPRAQTHSGNFASEGIMRWNGISLQFDTPDPGEMVSIDLIIQNQIVRYEFSRSGTP